MSIFSNFVVDKIYIRIEGMKMNIKSKVNLTLLRGFCAAGVRVFGLCSAASGMLVHLGADDALVVGAGDDDVLVQGNPTWLDDALASEGYFPGATPEKRRVQGRITADYDHYCALCDQIKGLHRTIAHFSP